MRKVVILSTFVIIFICLIFTPTLAKTKKALLDYDFDNCKRIANLPECECTNGGIRCIDGVNSRALAFLGRGDFIKEKNVPTGSFTVSFWMRTVERGANEQDGNFFGCTGLVDAGVWGVNLCGSRIGFGSGKTTITSKTGVTTGRWNFVAATMDFEMSEMKLFINGKLEAEAKGVLFGAELNVASFIYIGASQALEGSYYFGSLDELKVYGRVLSAEEIKKAYDKLDPYRVRVVQLATKEKLYEERDFEKEVDVERRPRPTPR